MSSLIERCRVHLETVDEDYVAHLRFASGTGLAMIAGGIACLVHGLMPFLFETTGSTTIKQLAQKIERRGHAPKRLHVARTRFQVRRA